MSQQINLYNAAFVPKRQLLTGQSLAISTAVLLCLLLGAGTWSSIRARGAIEAADAAKAELKQAQAMLETEKRAFDARKPTPALQAEVDQAQALLGMRDEVLAALGKSLGSEDKPGAGFADYLKGLARHARSGLWLTGFSVDAGGEGMALTGRTLDKALLPEYVRGLNAEPAFVGKSFAGLQVDAHDATIPAAVPGAVPPRLTSTAAALPPRYLEFRLMAELTKDGAP